MSITLETINNEEVPIFWKVNMFISWWNIAKDMCTDLMDLTVFEMIVKNGSFDPVRPQTRFCPSSSTTVLRFEVMML